MTSDEFDVVVVGSGAAGMTAALAASRHGLDVVVVEKATAFGGSTARSGGGVWVPNNDGAAQRRARRTRRTGARVPVGDRRRRRAGRPAASRCWTMARRCSPWSRP